MCINKYVKFSLIIFISILFLGCFYKKFNIKNENIPIEEYKIFSQILRSYLNINNAVKERKIKKPLTIVKYTYLSESMKNSISKSELISDFDDYLSKKLIENNKFNYKLENLFDSEILRIYTLEFNKVDFGIYFSRVAYDKNKINCYVYFVDARRPLAGRGYIVSLTNNKGDWEVKDMIEVWIS